MTPADLTVRLRRQCGRWRAALVLEGMEISTGGHATAKEAATAALERVPGLDVHERPADAGEGR